MRWARGGVLAGAVALAIPLTLARVGSYLGDVAAPAFPGRSPARAVRTVLAGLVSTLTRLAGH